MPIVDGAQLGHVDDKSADSCRPDTRDREPDFLFVFEVWLGFHNVLIVAENKKAIKREVVDTDAKVKQFLDRITETDNKTVISAYEARITEREAKKLVLVEQIAKCDAPIKDFDQSFRTALECLASPWNLWKSDRIEDKHMALKLTFPNRLMFDRINGFRTPELSLPFKALGDFSMLKREMARPERFERPTLRFVV